MMHIATVYIHTSTGSSRALSRWATSWQHLNRSASNTSTETNNRYFEAKQAQMSQTSVTSQSNVTGQNESDEAAGQSHNSWHRTQSAPSKIELTSRKVYIANASSDPKPPQGWCQHRMAVSAAHVYPSPVGPSGGLTMLRSV